MEQFLALKASAGSGKTFSLSLRFIYLLFCGANPHQILTLTFTKKASNEMHHRIYEFLKALKQAVDSGNEEESEIFKALVAKGLDKQLIRENIFRIYTEFMQSNPRITTIDAFFHFVLKKFCWYVGVSSSFEVGNTPLELINERFLVSLSPTQCQNLAYFCFSQGMKLSEFLALLQKLSLLPKELLERSFSTDIEKLVSEQEIEQRVNAGLREIYEYLASLPKCHASGLKFFRDKEFKDIIKDKCDMLVKWSGHSYFKNVNLAPMDCVRDEIFSLLRLYYIQRQKQLFGELKNYMYLFTHAKTQVLRSHNTLGFDEVMMKNYELLGENIEREFFYFRLDERISHILLDEFQDTSVMQFRILKPMIDEICAGEGRIGDRSFFVVGDEKQGIYGFRGSFGGVFEAATKPLAQESLAYNYRSSQRVVEFNNALFHSCYTGYKKQKIPESREALGYVRVLAESEKEEWREELKHQVYEELMAILNAGAREEDIAILVFKNSEALELRDYIVTQNPRLNIITEASASLFEKREVKILKNGLEYILLHEQYMMIKNQNMQEGEIESREQIELISNAMRLCQKRIIKLLGKKYGQRQGTKEGLGQEAHICETLNTLASDLSSHNTLNFASHHNTPSAIILRLIEAFCLGSSVSLKFLELSCGYAHASEFLEAMPRLVCNAPAQSNRGVRIMTIHKSKGLEFEHVILCDRLSGKNVDSEKIIYGYEEAAMSEIFYSFTNRECFDEGYARAKEARDERNNKEAINVLYVAFTRAKYGLSVARRKTRSHNKSAFEVLGLDKFVQNDEITCRSRLDSEKEAGRVEPYLVLEDMHSFGRQSDFVRQSDFALEEDREQGILTYQAWQNIIFGNALHSVFELHLGYGMGAERLLHILRNRYGFALSEKSLKEALNFGLGCVEDEQFRVLLAGKKCVCEVSYISKERLYRMDTLLYDENECIVLDYKSGAYDKEAQEAQVREYMRFLREVDSKRHTKGFIIYPLNPRGKRVCEVRE